MVKGGPVSIRTDTRPSFQAYASNGIQVLLTRTLSLCGKDLSKGVFDRPFLTVGQLFWPQFVIAPPVKLLDFGYVDDHQLHRSCRYSYSLCVD